MPIWKYPIPIEDSFEIEMPQGARVLSVDTQDGKPYIWVLVNTSSPKGLRPFRLLGTGHPSDDVGTSRFVGTFQMRNGDLVYHLFDWTR